MRRPRTAVASRRRHATRGRDLAELQGDLRLALGEREHLLHAGEAAEFDTHTPHGPASATTEPVEVLHLMSPQGRRVHLREL